MNLPSTRNLLWGQLAAIRIDVELRKLAGERSESLRLEEMRALQIAMELRAVCLGSLQ